jgi:hypothetical protein
VLEGFVLRLTPEGAVDYATYLGDDAGQGGEGPSGIAVNASGSAFVIGLAPVDFPTTPGAYQAAPAAAYSIGASYLARLSPDGSSLTYATYIDAQGARAFAVAVDSSDNATLLAALYSSEVLRFNPLGTAVTLSKSLPGSTPSGVAVDVAGNTYIAVSASANYPVNNSLAACGVNSSAGLTVLDSNGDVLQATYIAGSSSLVSPALALGVDSTVYVVGAVSRFWCASPRMQRCNWRASGMRPITTVQG